MIDSITALHTVLAGLSGWHTAALALALWCVGSLTRWPWARALAAGFWLASVLLALWASPPALALLVGAVAALLAYSLFAYRVAGAWPPTRTRRWPRLPRRYRGAQVSVLYRTEPGRGWVQLADRLWAVECDREISPGQLVSVTGQRRQALICERLEQPSPPAPKARNHRTGKQVKSG